MFTGIVAEVGHVVEGRPGRLGIEARGLVSRLAIGGSIAVNGCCLTATVVEGDVFFADVVPETLRRTNLGQLGAGDGVNLELPMTASAMLDGHLVQGHVDSTAEVVAMVEATAGAEVSFELPSSMARYVAEKGSVAVDGTSLTVARVRDGAGIFEVALIPHTLEHTIAGGYHPGRRVNLEVDVIARYTERLLDRC